MVMTKQQEENKRLVERFPFLLPRSRWTDLPEEDYDYSWTELDAMPDGWRKAFGEMMCSEIKCALLSVSQEALDNYRIVQIKEKYGCYDPETEVLTKDGWKHFYELSFEDEIATLNEATDCLEYQRPDDIIAYKYNGKMYHLQNRGIDIMVTDNHRLYVAKGSYYNGSKNNEKRLYDFELTTPDKYFMKDKRFKKGCKWIGEKRPDIYKIKGLEYSNYTKLTGVRHYVLDNLELPLIPFIRFLGFYIAEGCCSDTKESKNRKTFSTIDVAYNYTSEEISNIADGLIRDIGFKPKKEAERSKRFYSATLAKWLHENCGHLAQNKKVPSFIKTLPSEYIEEFLKYLYLGDGHKTKTAHVLTTTSKQLSDDVQELLLKAGYAFSVIEREPNEKDSYIRGKPVHQNYKTYNINWLQNTEIEIDMSKAKDTKSFVEEWIRYKGMVYCVTVPNHIIYVRRNGKGYWCGNSLRWYDNGYPADSGIGDIIGKYEVLSGHICMRCGKPDVPIVGDWWIFPFCKECYLTDERNTAEEWEEYAAMEDNLMMPDVYKYTKYIRDEDAIVVEIDIKNTADKIRRKWNDSRR